MAVAAVARARGERVRHIAGRPPGRPGGRLAPSVFLAQAAGWRWAVRAPGRERRFLVAAGAG
eukprot:3596569-Lingulodinium_polyedra.AAC.1